VALLSLGPRLRRWSGQELADLRQALHPSVIGQQPVVAHPHQPLGQHVQQEASQQFGSLQHQGLVLAVVVVAVTQMDLVTVQAQDARVAVAMRWV